MACVCVCVSIPPPLAVRACAAVFASAPLGAGQGGDIPCEPERETKSQPKESNRAKPPPRTARPARDTAHTAAHTARHRVPQAPRVRDTPAHRGSPRLTATRRQATHRDSRQTATHRDRPRQTATHRDRPRQATHRHTPASPTSALLETATKTFDRRYPGIANPGIAPPPRLEDTNGTMLCRTHATSGCAAVAVARS